MSPNAPPGPGPGRARILDAAQRLFARNGFAATPIKAIAADAGVATGLLYYHFGTKDELYATLVAERSLAPQFADVLAESPDDDPESTLRRVANAFLDVLEERDEMARILLQDAAADERGGSRLHRLLLAEVDSLTGYLRRATHAGQNAAETAGRLLLTNLLVGAVLLPLPDREQFVRSTVKLALASLT